MDASVTTLHLRSARQRRKPAALLPIPLPNSDFLGSEYNGRAEGGGGDQPGAGRRKPRINKLARKFYPKGRPHAILLLEKKYAWQTTRIPDAVASSSSP